KRSCRGVEQRGAIDCSRRRELLVETREQLREIRAAKRQRGQAIGVDLREPDFLQRARERARKPRHGRDRLEVRERVFAARIKSRARGDRLGRKVRRGRQLLVGEDRRGKPRGELSEAESVQADRGATRAGNRTREIIRGSAGSGNDQYVAAPGLAVDESTRFGQSEFCCRGFEQADHLWL